MLRDLTPYNYVGVARHQHTFKVPTIGDLQHIIFDLKATVTTSNANGNAIENIEYIELLGNGSDPIVRYEGAELTEFHEVYNHSVARNEAMANGDAKYARFVLPFFQHRKRWNSLNLRVQFVAITAVDADATEIAIEMNVACRYGPIDYSMRLKSKVLNSTEMDFDIPSDQGLLTAVAVFGTTNDRMTDIFLLDRHSQEVYRTHFARMRAEMQKWVEATDVAGNWAFGPVPACPVSKDVELKVYQGTAEDVRAYFMFRSGTVALQAMPTTEEAERGQRNPDTEVFMEMTKYEEQLSEATSQVDKRGGTPISPG